MQVIKILGMQTHCCEQIVSTETRTIDEFSRYNLATWCSWDISAPWRCIRSGTERPDFVISERIWRRAGFHFQLNKQRIERAGRHLLERRRILEVILLTPVIFSGTLSFNVLSLFCRIPLFTKYASYNFNYWRMSFQLRYFSRMSTFTIRHLRCKMSR
jgi:hypothetical protein